VIDWEMQGGPTNERKKGTHDRRPDGHASHPSHGIGHLISMAFSFAHPLAHTPVEQSRAVPHPEKIHVSVHAVKRAHSATKNKGTKIPRQQNANDANRIMIESLHG
jgi:hypothetical protein